MRASGFHHERLKVREGKKKEMMGSKSLPRGDDEDVRGRHLPRKTGGEGQRGQRQQQASTMRDRW